MKAERDKRQTLLEAEAHKAAVITRAEGDKQAAILSAEGERDARVARAEGEAKAVELQKQAEANGLKALKDAQIDERVLELRRYEALVKMANGNAAKIIVPADTAMDAKRGVLFSEMTGLGDSTHSTTPNVVTETQADACCDRFSENEFSHPELNNKDF